jgi:hypothetical protein
VVLEFLRMMNPNILAVTGRACQPQDQGLVENMNKFVKRTLPALLSEQQSYGNNPNWTTVLGAISPSINSAEGRGPDQMNPYKAVYGQKMDHMVMCTKDQARACWTLPQILKVTDDPEFQEYAEQNYFLADEEDNNNGNDDADGYFSDGPLPYTEMEEVDDEFFFDNILVDDSVNNVNAHFIGAEGNAEDVRHEGGGVWLDSDVDNVVGGALLAAIGPLVLVPVAPYQANAVSDGEELHHVTKFVPPQLSGNDFLAVHPQQPHGYCLPVNTKLCDWEYYGLCPTGLEPEPCQKEGANCNRSAHRLCVSGWETRYDMGQQSIATFCMKHHPALAQP